MGDSILTLDWTRQALYLSKHKYITFSEGNPGPAGISGKMNYLLSLSLHFFSCTSATILCWREINGLGTSLVWPIVSHSVCLEGRDWTANSILTQTHTHTHTCILQWKTAIWKDSWPDRIPTVLSAVGTPSERAGVDFSHLCWILTEKQHPFPTVRTA